MAIGFVTVASTKLAVGCIRPLFTAQIRIFGSYLQRDIDRLEDVDVELSLSRRITDPKAIREYTKSEILSHSLVFQPSA
jgi:predicted nucleotidyltransferase